MNPSCCCCLCVEENKKFTCLSGLTSEQITTLSTSWNAFIKLWVKTIYVSEAVFHTSVITTHLTGKVIGKSSMNTRGIINYSDLETPETAHLSFHLISKHVIVHPSPVTEETQENIFHSSVRYCYKCLKQQFLTKLNIFCHKLSSVSTQCRLCVLHTKL